MNEIIRSQIINAMSVFVFWFPKGCFDRTARQWRENNGIMSFVEQSMIL